MTEEEKARLIRELERQKETETDPTALLDLEEKLFLLRDDLAQTWFTRTPSGQRVEILQLPGGRAEPWEKTTLSTPGDPAAGERSMTALRRAHLLTGHLQQALQDLVRQFRTPRSRTRPTVLEKHTGIADKDQAALAVRKNIRQALIQMQDELHMLRHEKPYKWAKRLANTAEFPVSANKIREAVRTEDLPWND